MGCWQTNVKQRDDTTLKKIDGNLYATQNRRDIKLSKAVEDSFFNLVNNASQGQTFDHVEPDPKTQLKEIFEIKHKDEKEDQLTGWKL